jgi:ATP-dependent protease HslVU (ClpYQ) peptidase subunit
MTTLVAVQGPRWVVVGADSRVSEEYGRTYTLAKAGSKVTKNRRYLLGAAGDVRAINILAYAFTPPDAQSFVDAKLDRFITRDFIPALRACFEKNGYGEVRNSESGSAEAGSEVLVAVNGSVYIIGQDYSWARDSTGLYGLGSGGDFAVGALYATLPDGSNSIEEARDAVKKALTVGARLDSATGQPFSFFTQHRPV